MSSRPITRFSTKRPQRSTGLESSLSHVSTLKKAYPGRGRGSAVPVARRSRCDLPSPSKRRLQASPRSGHCERARPAPERSSRPPSARRHHHRRRCSHITHHGSLPPAHGGKSGNCVYIVNPTVPHLGDLLTPGPAAHTAWKDPAQEVFKPPTGQNTPRRTGPIGGSRLRSSWIRASGSRVKMADGATASSFRQAFARQGQRSH